MTGDRFAPVLRELQPLAERFAAAGHRLFLVGGTVRDLLLAGVPDGLADAAIDSSDAEFDIDATTTARPDEIKRCLQGWADAIWTQGERFGTIGAMKRVPAGAAHQTIDRIYEITTHRAEAYDDRSRKPEVEFSFDIEADLSRRDFTVNAMAIELTASADDDPVLVDPFGGRHDLDERVLRTPRGPEASFSDDPLRMLRAARFIARYGLQPEPSLLRAVRAMGDRMQIVSAERIRDELDKLLAAEAPGDGLRFVTATGLLQHVAPELIAATSQPDERCHAHLWDHTVALVDAVQRDDGTVEFDRRIVRLAALMRPLGTDRARVRLQALRYSNDDTAAIVGLIDLAGPLLYRLANDDAPWTDADVRRHLRDAAGQRSNLHALIRAQAAVHIEPLASRLRTGLAVLASSIRSLEQRESVDDLGPQLDGAQVMALLGIEPGPVVGDALAHLVRLRLDEGLLANDDLHSRLIQWWNDHKEE